MTDEILAKSIGVPDEVAKSTGRIGARLLLLVFEKVDQKLYTRTQMLVKHLVVEACIAYGEAGKFPRVAVWILAASYGSVYQAVLQELLVEVARVAAQIADEVADFGPDARVLMADERVEVRVDIGVVYGLVELF